MDPSPPSSPPEQPLEVDSHASMVYEHDTGGIHITVTFTLALVFVMACTCCCVVFRSSNEAKVRRSCGIGGCDSALLGLARIG